MTCGRWRPWCTPCGGRWWPWGWSRAPFRPLLWLPDGLNLILDFQSTNQQSYVKRHIGLLNAVSKSRIVLTAAVMLLIGGGIILLVTDELHVVGVMSKGSPDSPVTLPAGMMRMITGKAGFSGRTVNAEIYNGTDWTLTDVDVVVSNKKKGQERRFRLEIWDRKVEWQKDARVPTQTKTRETLIPYGTGKFEGDVGSFLDEVETSEHWAWYIESARGFKR